MKFKIICLLFLITRLSYGLKSSTHYKFNYFSVFKNGIPEDGNQAAGMSLKAVLDVYLENKDGIAILKLSDVRTVAFNEDIGCSHDTEFPDDRYTPLNEKFVSIFEQPFRANLRGSQPFSIEFEETEHRWISNVRKGIASIFKNEILKGNFETQEEEDSVSSLFHKGNLVNTFKVKEESILGICKTDYEIHEIKDASFFIGKDFFPTQNGDSNETFWRAVRSVNFDNCKEKVTYNVHTVNEKRNKEENLRFTRSSVSSYILRGSPGNFEIYSAEVEGVATFPLSSFDEHAGRSTTKQKLILIEKTTNEELPTLGSNLQQSATWMFQVWSSFTKPKDSKPVPWIIYPEENTFNAASEIYGSKTFNADQLSKIKVKILDIIEKASNVLTDINYETKDSQWQEIPDLLNILTYYIKTLPKADIIKIFDHFFERKVKLERRIVIDAAAATGSHNAFEAILDYISEDKLEPFEIRNVFNTLSKADSTINIARIMDYIMTVQLRHHSGLPAVYLNFANYLSEFCIHKARNYNPTKEPFSGDCVLITERFIPHLKEIIYNETLTWERTFAVRVLEHLRSYFTFDILTPIIDGRIEGPIALKAMALRALKNWDPEHDREQSVFRKPAMDLLKEVYTDYNQDFQVRAAALVSYISWQPSTSFWFNLAQSTWNEPSIDFSSFTSNLIKLYAEEKVPALESQWKDASSALKFTKAPAIHRESFINSLLNIFFKNYAKLYTIDESPKHVLDAPSVIFQILTKDDGLSLLKYENYIMYEEPASEREYTKYVRSPHSNKFFEAFSREINLEKMPYYTSTKYQVFFEIFNKIPNTMPPRITFDPLNFVRDSEDELVSYGGRFMNFFTKSDFFPNELGLPTFIYSTMPTVFSFTSKYQPQTPGTVYGVQGVLRASTVYSRGVGVTLPWATESYSIMSRTALEFTLPVGVSEKRIVGREGPAYAQNYYLDFAYKKKFPVFRLSNTPMTLIYNWNPKNKNELQSFQLIKKFNVEQNVISEVHPFTGIKYELVMKGDSKTKTPVSLHDFQLFPKLPFKVWNFDLYLNPEESQTKKVLAIYTGGKIEEQIVNDKAFEANHKNPPLSFSDKTSERFKKLAEAFGGRAMHYHGFKFIFTGEKEMGYETFYVETSKNDVKSANMIGFTRTEIPEISTQPASFCIDLRKKSPSTLEKDAAFISQKEIKKESFLKFLFNCSQPILEAHALYSLSDEGKEEISGKCNSKYDNTIFNPQSELNYDTIDIGASYTKDLESFDFVVTKDILNSLKNLADFPSYEKLSDNYKIKDGILQLKVQRNVYHKDWNLHLLTSSGYAHLKTLPDNSLIKSLLGLSEYIPQNGLDALTGMRYFYAKNKCTLQGNSVTTFDGVHFNYNPSTCWTLASHVPKKFYSSVNTENFFFIRSSEGTSKIPDFKYILSCLNLEIEFTNDELKVNGTVVDKFSEDSPDLKTIEKDVIYKIGHSYLIYDCVPRKKAAVIVSTDKIEIYNENIQIQENGICGPTNMKAYPEFIGPRRCLYYNAQKFVASWSGHSDTCDAATLKEYRKEADDFQANCEPYQSQHQDGHLNQRCLFYGWKLIKSKENKLCISAKPLPFCLKTCDVTKHQNIKVTYKCWPEEKAPEFLKTSFKNKLDIVTTPIPADPFSYEHFTTEIATLCKQF